MPDDLSEPIDIPQQREMYLTRHILSWFDEDETGDTNVEDQSGHTINEVANLLHRLVVDLKDIYGQHWNSMYRFISLGLKVRISTYLFCWISTSTEY